MGDATPFELGNGKAVPVPVYPVPEGINVLPGLAPAQWFVEQAQLGPYLATALCIATINGLQYSFWPEDSAVPLGQELQRIGNLTKAGLHIPRSGGPASRPKP